MREVVERLRPGRGWETAAVASLALWSWIEFFVTGDLWGLAGGVAFAVAAGALVLNARRGR
jgi:hypothetical protein